jgi:PadR family transcriptional regulator PadR
MDPIKSDAIRKGLLEFVILAIVSSDPVYVADIIRKLSETEFATREGTLYPLLSRMRRDGLLDHDWQESASGPPRKYYRLTAAGRTQLADFRTYWTSLSHLFDTFGT